MAVLVLRRGIIFLGKGELWTSRPFTHEPSNWVTIMGSSGERTFFYSTCQRLAGNEEEPVKEEYFHDDLHFSPPTFFFFFFNSFVFSLLWWSFPFYAKHSSTWRRFCQYISLVGWHFPLSIGQSDVLERTLYTSIHTVFIAFSKIKPSHSFYPVYTATANPVRYLKAAFSHFKSVFCRRQFRKQRTQ